MYVAAYKGAMYAFDLGAKRWREVTKNNKVSLFASVAAASALGNPLAKGYAPNNDVKLAENHTPDFTQAKSFSAGLESRMKFSEKKEPKDREINENSPIIKKLAYIFNPKGIMHDAFGIGTSDRNKRKLTPRPASLDQDGYRSSVDEPGYKIRDPAQARPVNPDSPIKRIDKNVNQIAIDISKLVKQSGNSFGGTAAENPDTPDSDLLSNILDLFGDRPRRRPGQTRGGPGRRPGRLPLPPARPGGAGPAVKGATSALGRGATAVIEAAAPAFKEAAAALGPLLKAVAPVAARVAARLNWAATAVMVAGELADASIAKKRDDFIAKRGDGPLVGVNPLDAPQSALPGAASKMTIPYTPESFPMALDKPSAPTSAPAPPPAGPTDKAVKGENVPESFLMNFFKNKGYTSDESAAIVGNLAHESGGLNTAALGDNGSAFGLAQWRGARRTALEQFAAQRGVPITDPGVQAEFVHHELQTTENGTFKKMKAASAEGASVGDLTHIFARGYERPATNKNTGKLYGADDREKRAMAAVSASPRTTGTAVMASSAAVDAASTSTSSSPVITNVTNNTQVASAAPSFTPVSSARSDDSSYRELSRRSMSYSM